MIRALVEQGTPADSVLRHSVETALAGAGVEVPRATGTAPDPGPGSVPVVLVLRDVSPTVLDRVAQAQASGQRLLAVAPPGPHVATDRAWDLLAAGAADVIAWDQAAEPAASIAARLARWAVVDETLAQPVVRDNLVGASPAWRSAVRDIVEAAVFTDASVLVTGESGTGKELVARLIHTLDRRPRKGELIVLDCTTVVPTLSGSEFFGHERGAFTGAVSARDGAFAQADGGTLFLDEIGELPPALQAELLRVIQEGTYKRVGSDTWRRTRFRLVCATNRPLADAIGTGAFRADLYHRIAAWAFELPPLRDRPDDVPALARHFLAETRPGSEPPALDEAVARHLAARAYPGNVRELRLLMARIAARHVGPGPITLGDLPATERANRSWGPPAAAGSGSHGAGLPSGSHATASQVAAPAEATRPNGAWREALEAGVAQAVDAGIALETLGRLAKELAVARALEREGHDTGRTARRLGVSERAVQARLAARRDGEAGRPSGWGEAAG